ncbi:hypothetical protein VII00023_09354, partial [Vibrio ichthyoenteri ATCC 700023]
MKINIQKHSLTDAITIKMNNTSLSKKTLRKISDILLSINSLPYEQRINILSEGRDRLNIVNSNVVRKQIGELISSKSQRDDLSIFNVRDLSILKNTVDIVIQACDEVIFELKPRKNEIHQHLSCDFARKIDKYCSNKAEALGTKNRLNHKETK